MIRRIDWYGMEAVEFSKGDYTALLIPSMGANLVRLANTRLGIEILRTPKPEEVENFKVRPHVYGLPLLLPPNRIAGAHFEFEGRSYDFPVTIPAEGAYHHGVIKSQPFMVSKAIESDDEVLIEARFYSNAANDVIFRHLPHEFKCKMIFRLSNTGLEHSVVFFNRSQSAMPIGVGYHTPLNVPFMADSVGDDYRLVLSAGERWLLTEQNLPSDTRTPLEGAFEHLADEGVMPVGHGPISAAFTLAPIEVDGKEYRGAIIRNVRNGHSVFYRVDEKTKYWTVWNNGGEVPWICPEPMSWATNAPNMRDLPDELTGFASIEPNGKWSMTTWLYAE